MFPIAFVLALEFAIYVSDSEDANFVVPRFAEFSRENCGLFGGYVYRLLFMFSACGGMHTGSKLPVLTAYFQVLA